MSRQPETEPGEKVLFTPGGKPIQHGGSGSAYANYGCKCLECRQANTARANRRRAERRHEDIPEGVVHNASTYSNWACRCDDCATAHAEKERELQAERKAKRRSPHDSLLSFNSIEEALAIKEKRSEDV